MKVDELTNILLKLESDGAVEVANRYISLKYTELFVAAFLITGILIGFGFLVSWGIKIAVKLIKENS